MRRVEVIKDVVLFVVGLGGIIFQLVTGNVNVALLAVFTAMTGVPGLTNLVLLLKGGFATELPPSTSAPPRSDSDSGN
jgi:hypothetical protein